MVVIRHIMGRQYGLPAAIRHRKGFYVKWGGTGPCQPPTVHFLSGGQDLRSFTYDKM